MAILRRGSECSPRPWSQWYLGIDERSGHARRPPQSLPQLLSATPRH
jgi:hypothetical protein